ncbi:hypothetical protein NEOLEDRAFT_1179774 [Neolentinus lepideus HHB14362 ss-1]|uniref:Protein kinase domain-containing protein n=1 Tax=Neolentinus lepideus HHB14362 ss-1 TaxID=1314782 RepID=A0A165RGK0_9AGAM|nr:hypothetical protein NEOLEDRAFT_1179774 [Neolentinus lepideus HHB14362 ss-1]
MEAKLCDFGDAKKHEPGPQAADTTGTIEDRPLEILLQSNNYDFSMSMFDVGTSATVLTVLDRCLAGRYHFNPLLVNITNYLGRPTDREISEANGTIESNTLPWDTMPSIETEPGARQIKLQNMLADMPVKEFAASPPQLMELVSSTHPADDVQPTWQFEYWMNAARSTPHSLRSL